MAPSAVLVLARASRRGDAVVFATTFAVLLTDALALVDTESAGRFHQAFFATAAGGATWSTVWRVAPRFGRELLIKPFDLAVPVAVAVWCSARNFSHGWVHLYLFTAALVAVIIFVSPGTASNHLVDLQLTATLAVGVALARGELPPTVGTAVYGALAAALVVISIALPGVPSVAAEIRRAGPRPRTLATEIHGEFLAGRPYLAIDPIVAILNGERPWLLDYATAERVGVTGAPLGRDLATRVQQQFFGAIVVPSTGAFPVDMRRGDSGFAAAEERYWTEYDSPLAPLFRSSYLVAAGKGPFVVLHPRGEPHVQEF